MGFRMPNLEPAYVSVRSSLSEIRSRYNDGYTQMNCKRELYLLKCWLDEQYSSLPTFGDEKQWEQERVVSILKR